MIAHFAVMNSRTSICIGHIALFHDGVNNPVVGALHALLNAAAQESQGIAQHRASLGNVIQHCDACKSISPGREAFEEMTEQFLMVVITQDVENEAVSNLH